MKFTEKEVKVGQTQCLHRLISKWCYHTMSTEPQWIRWTGHFHKYAILHNINWLST